MIRFSMVALFFWSGASLVQANEAPPLVTVGKDGVAVAAAGAPERVKKAVAAGNKLLGKPYKYGGGHGRLKDEGYDCSGAVSFVLRELGVLEGARSSGGFFAFGEAGKGDHITVWVRKGHVFLTIAGVRFDTQGQDESDGPKWRLKERSKEKFVPRRLPST